MASLKDDGSTLRGFWSPKRGDTGRASAVRGTGKAVIFGQTRGIGKSGDGKHGVLPKPMPQSLAIGPSRTVSDNSPVPAPGVPRGTNSQSARSVVLGVLGDLQGIPPQVPSARLPDAAVAICFC